MLANNLPKDQKDLLINGLTQLSSDWALTPLLGNKAPYRDNWQHETPMSRADIQKAIQQGDLVTYTKKDNSTYQKRQFPQGYGIRTGVISGGIVAVDLDGPSATPKIIEISSGAGLPKTVAFSSGRPGRSQHLFKIPEQYWSAIKTTKYKTGTIGDNGKPEQIEFRWDGCQSVLPPSVHPTTGQYRWVEGCAPWECEIAEAPLWLIELMLNESAQDPAPLLNQPDAAKVERSQFESKWTDTDWALSYLNALSPSRADDYDEWLAVGMALHSVSDSLLIDWDRWSSQSEKYKPGDCDKKWKSFKSSGVSIGSIAHMAKQDGWRSPFERSNSPRNAYTGDRNSPSTRRGGSGGGGTPLISSVSLRDRVLEILNRNHSASEQKSAFLELAGVTNRTLREIEQLAEAIEADLSSQSAQSDNTKETNKLVEYREQTLDLRRVFPAPLANYLLTKADSDRLDPAFVYQYLWNAIGLSLGAHIGIRGKEGTAGNDWLEFPIFYNVVIAPPSSGKSQTMRAVLGPIKEKQNAERAEYKKAQKHLEGLKEKWKNKSPEEKERLKDSDQNPDVYAEQMPQPPKVRLIEAGSPEGAFKRMSELPPMSGCSLAFDELIRILSLDQYKNQGGDSRQVLMEAWAYPFSTAFVRSDDDDTPSLNKICISITGGIQPSKAKKLLSDPDDGDGLLSRFLITQTKTPENFAIWSDTKVDINQALSELYKFLEGLHYDLRQKVYGDEHFQSVVDGKQVILQFDAAAEKRWRQWWEHVRHEQRRNEHENPALSGYLGKILSQTLRIALGLHCVELAYEAKADPLTVGLETLEKAIYAAKFHIGQFRLLQAHNDTDSLPGHLERIHQFAKRKGKPVSASQVQMTVFRRSERKPTLAQIREYFKQLADTGAVTLVGEGKDLKIQVVIIMTSYDKKYDNEQTLRSTTNQGLQELVDKNYDNYDNFDNRVSAPVEPESDEYQSDGVDSESSTNGICHNCHNFADDAPSTPDLELNAGVDDLSENLSDRVINYDNPYDGYDITADASPDAKTAVIKYDGSEDTLPAQGNGGVKADDTETADCEPNGTVQSTVPSGTGFGAITPPEPQQSLTPAAVNTASVDFKIGDTVAHSDPYTVAYTFYGVVEEVVGDEILVRWTERQGKANEYEIYNTSELRRIESQVP